MEKTKTCVYNDLVLLICWHSLNRFPQFLHLTLSVYPVDPRLSFGQIIMDPPLRRYARSIVWAAARLPGNKGHLEKAERD